MSKLYGQKKFRIREEKFKEQEHKCFYCSREMRLIENIDPHCCDDDICTLDHYIPKYWGGTDALKNLVACCYKCNNLKGDMRPEEFIKRLKENDFPAKRMRKKQRIAERRGRKAQSKFHDHKFLYVLKYGAKHDINISFTANNSIDTSNSWSYN